VSGNCLNGSSLCLFNSSCITHFKSTLYFNRPIFFSGRDGNDVFVGALSGKLKESVKSKEVNA
jgi:hypothetical protein